MLVQRKKWQQDQVDGQQHGVGVEGRGVGGRGGVRGAEGVGSSTKQWLKLETPCALI